MRTRHTSAPNESTNGVNMQATRPGLTMVPVSLWKNVSTGSDRRKAGLVVWAVKVAGLKEGSKALDEEVNAQMNSSIRNDAHGREEKG